MTKKIIPVVIGLIQQKELFLIAKRPGHVEMAHYWEFPGGKVEAGEAPFAALVRELKEEIDIIVTEADYLMQHQAVFDEKILELNLWRITQFSKTPTSNEGQVLQWVTAQQFCDYEFLPSNYALLDFIKTLGPQK